MTEENYNYRTNQLLLRSNFKGTGRFKMPVIPKAEFSEDEFKDLLLIGFDRAKAEDNRHSDRMEHFFLYDYKFERVWEKPVKPRINYPDGAPEFKSYGGTKMNTIVSANCFEDDKFKTISEFKDCIIRGSEIVFVWKDKVFGISPGIQKTPMSETQILISLIDTSEDKMEKSEFWCNTPDELLDYIIDGVRLGEIVTDIEVFDRTL